MAKGDINTALVRVKVIGYVDVAVLYEEGKEEAGLVQRANNLALEEVLSTNFESPVKNIDFGSTKGGEILELDIDCLKFT